MRRIDALKHFCSPLFSWISFTCFIRLGLDLPLTDACKLLPVFNIHFAPRITGILSKFVVYFEILRAVPSLVHHRRTQPRFNSMSFGQGSSFVWRSSSFRRWSYEIMHFLFLCFFLLFLVWCFLPSVLISVAHPAETGFYLCKRLLRFENGSTSLVNWCHCVK